MKINYRILHDGSYELTAEYCHECGFWPPLPAYTNHIAFTPDGLLRLTPGFRWNGANFLDAFVKHPWMARASAVHDALCRLIDCGKIGVKPYRKLADEILIRIAREDGCPVWASYVIYAAVRCYAIIKY